MTTPDYYPLTLKALVAGCNQKSSRTPVMALPLGDVGSNVNSLRAAGLITARMDGRVDRFEQHLSRKLRLSLETRAILCVLMLRGALTHNEIRIATSRMIDFNNTGALESVMVTLINGEHPFVTCLGRGSGQREDRYAHCLCGTPVLPPEPTQKHTEGSGIAGTQEQRIVQLEHEVAELKTALNDLRMIIDTDPACLSTIES